jgi:hypothetical protein
VLLAYDAVSLGNRIPTFRGNLMSSSGIELRNTTWKFRPLKTRSVCLVETSYPIIRTESSAAPPGKPQTSRKVTRIRTVLGLVVSKIRRRRDALYWSVQLYVHVQLYPHVRCTVPGKFPLHLPISCNTSNVNPLAESAVRCGTRADEDCGIRGPTLIAGSD